MPTCTPHTFYIRPSPRPLLFSGGISADAALAGRVLWVSLGKRLELYSQGGAKTDMPFVSKVRGCGVTA